MYVSMHMCDVTLKSHHTRTCLNCKPHAGTSGAGKMQFTTQKCRRQLSRSAGSMSMSEICNVSFRSFYTRTRSTSGRRKRCLMMLLRSLPWILMVYGVAVAVRLCCVRYMRACVFVLVGVCVCVCVCMCTCACVGACFCDCLHVCPCLGLCISLCMMYAYIYAYIYIYIYIYIHTYLYT